MKKNLPKPLILSFFASLFLILVLYRDAQFYGGGDIGLPLINPTKSFEITQFAWWGGQTTGFTYPAILSSTLLYFIFSFLQSFLSPILMQALFFFLIFFSSFSGSYYFYLSVTENKNISKWASIFYVLNPYMLFVVWHRFAHTTFVFVAVLPWTMFLLKKILDENKIKDVILFLLLTLVLSYSFGTPALLLTWWFIIGAFWLYDFIYIKQNSKDRRHSLYIMSSIFTLWVATNIWWMFPFFDTAGATLLATSSATGNVENVKGVSQYFTMEYAIRGINSFYLFIQKDWGDFYTIVSIRLISWIGFITILFGVYQNKLKNKYKKLFIFFLLFSLFFSKGSSMPLGNINLFFFTSIPQLAVFRNPFEKFGIVSVLGFAYFFSYGFYYLKNNLNKNLYQKIFLYSLTFGFIVIYHWPLLTGSIFGSLKNPAYASVPQSYWDASDWIDSEYGDDIRMLHLPLALGDGTKYNWEYPYQGLEVSQAFFPGSSISHLTGYRELDESLKKIAIAVKSNDEQLFNILLEKFDVDLIILHKDIDPDYYTQDNYENIFEFINSQSNIYKVNNFKELEIYKINNNTSKIVLDKSPYKLLGNRLYFDDRIYRHVNKSHFYLASTDDVTSGDQIILLPSYIANFPKVNIHPDNAIKELSHINYLPTDTLYPFVRLKEKVSLFAKTERQVFDKKIDLLGKRLVEAKSLLEKGDLDSMNNILDVYASTAEELYPSIQQRMDQMILANDTTAIEILKAQLSRQRIVVDQNNFYGFNPKIDSFFKDIDYLGLGYQDGGSDDGLLSVGIFSPIKLEYFTYFDKNSWNGNLPNNILLKSGFNNIDIDISSDNLIKDFQNEIELVSTKNRTYEYAIEKPDSNSQYYFSIEYKLIHGSEPILKVYEDINTNDENGEKIPSILHEVQPDKYASDWRQVKTSFRPNEFTTDTRIELSIDNWNNCLDINSKSKYLCEDIDYRKTFDRETKILIKNAQLTKSPIASVYLTNFDNNQGNSTENINYRRINDVKYIIDDIALADQLLVFKETYNDGWNIYDENNNVIKSDHVLVDNYANGWIVSDYEGEIVIKFEPQSRRKIGFLYGAIVLLFGSGLTLVLKNEKILK